MDQAKLKYLPSHEWADIQGGTCTVGITQYAVDQLTDVTHLQLPKVGTAVTAEKPFGEIESVKAVFDLYAPGTGEAVGGNAKLAAAPSPINADCYGAGCMLNIKPAAGATLDHLMTKAKYDE